MDKQIVIVPELLKNKLSPVFIEQLSQSLYHADKRVNQTDFIRAVLSNEWKDYELKERISHIAKELNTALPYAYDEQLHILSKVAPNFTGYTGTIFPTFIEIFGLNYEDLSLKKIKEFTTYSTSEFAIRPFIKQNPNCIEHLYEWSKDPNHHVRRLASEGCRPLLPWAMKLKQYVDDPTPIIPILKQLKNDPEDYVYRSVANNLNDISKNHPELALSLTKSWVNESKTTYWVSKHGLRTLLKKGNFEAMQLFGYGQVNQISVNKFQLAQLDLQIGESTTLWLEINNSGIKSDFRIEYAIDYLKKEWLLESKSFSIQNTGNN
jgi:3-methyladenine DNA glycosylase AlkC